MSSIIKVDQIQLADGSTPTAGDLGLNVTGSTLQTVNAVFSGSETFSSDSYADTSLTATITPSSTSSKVLVLVTQRLLVTEAQSGIGYGNNSNMGWKVVRDSTDLMNPGSDSGGKYSMGLAASDTSSGNLMMTAYINYAYLDSPGKATACVYKTQAAKGTSGMGSVYTRDGFITLIEIAG